MSAWHQRAGHLGDRRRHRAAAAGARRLGPGHHLRENIAGKETVKLNYKMMPRATYSHPQVASFGYTEAEAKEQGYEVKVGRFPFQPNGKALGLGDYAGFVKLITDAKYGEILGRAHGWPGCLRTAARADPGADDGNDHRRDCPQRARAPHPQRSLMEAAEAAEGHAINLTSKKKGGRLSRPPHRFRY
jgi:dihydrolipoamide dehydrogenase